VGRAEIILGRSAKEIDGLAEGLEPVNKAERQSLRDGLLPGFALSRRIRADQAASRTFPIADPGMVIGFRLPDEEMGSRPIESSASEIHPRSGWQTLRARAEGAANSRLHGPSRRLR
jgi:hypothetical protein